MLFVMCAELLNGMSMFIFFSYLMILYLKFSDVMSCADSCISENMLKKNMHVEELLYIHEPCFFFCVCVSPHLFGRRPDV